jgi:hypothetical protein
MYPHIKDKAPVVIQYVNMTFRDGLFGLPGRADVYARRCVWVRAQAEWLVQLATSLLLQP